MKLFCLMLSFMIVAVCHGQATNPKQDPFVVVLGTLQDGGSPHMGCQKDCCKVIDPNKKVAGILSFNQEDGAELELIGQLSSILDFNEIHSPEIILGISTDGKLITLYKNYEYLREDFDQD